MTTKGNKQTVATLARSVYRAERELEKFRKTFGEVWQPKVSDLEKLVETHDGQLADQSLEGEQRENDAFDLRRQVADLVDRLEVLEVPWWRPIKRRRVKFESLARRIARQREHTALVSDGIQRRMSEAKAFNEQIKGDLMPNQTTVDRMVETALETEAEADVDAIQQTQLEAADVADETN